MMFRFRLQKVLELRRSELERLRMQMGALEARRQRALQQLDDARRERAAYDRQCRQPSKQGLSALDLQCRMKTVSMHAARIDEFQRRLDAVGAEIESLREALLEANRRVKILERLREKKLDDFHREMNAQEQKILDDIPGRTGSLASVQAAFPARSRR